MKYTKLQVKVLREVAIVTDLFVNSAFIMLLLGAASTYWRSVPHPGYLPSLLLLVAVYVLTVFVSSVAIYQRKTLEENGTA